MEVVPATTKSSRPAWGWALGAAGLVFAARLHEIHLHTGDVPINDQWKIEAADVIAPWLDGTLRPGMFFIPHFEHVPALTRLLAWLQVVVTGRWDPFVQATVNALLFSGFVALVARWIATHLRPAAALAVVVLFAGNAALPHAWENITWGFQSQFPLALLCLFLQVQGSFRHAPLTRGWWGAQLAGTAGLFTLASMWMAPLAVVLASLWTDPRGDRRRLLPFVTVALGLAILAAIRLTAPPGHAFVEVTGSPLRFTHALLDLLGWPAGWPGALVVLNLPFLFFTLQLRGRRGAPAFDLTALALGLWAAAQAAGLAFARNADYGSYVSRYGELLAVLMLANSLALARLVPPLPRWRPAAATFVLLWVATVVHGAWSLSTGGHTAYFHEHAARHAQVRREAVQAYLQDADRTLLENPETRRVLYQVADQVTSLLDRARFRALLPASVNPANARDPAGAAVRGLQAAAPWLAGAAGLAFVLGARAAWRRECESPLPAFTFQPEPLLPWLAVPVTAAAGAAVFLWPDPLILDLGQRWQRFFHPPGSIGSLQLSLTQSSRPLPGDHLFGAAPLSPLDVRFQFSGTNPGGNEFTCTARSQSFTVTADWAIVPFSGFPVAHGNGLRLLLEEPDGAVIAEVACPGPGTTDILFWTADLRAYRGKQARLVLYDGRVDSDAWVAAAPPILTDDPALGAQMADALPMERMAPAHAACARLALAALLLLAGWFALRRKGFGLSFSPPN